jgi:hypothetical protein
MSLESTTFNWLIGRYGIRRGDTDQIEHKINAVQFHDGRWLLLVIAPSGELRIWPADETTVLEPKAVKMAPVPARSRL